MEEIKLSIEDEIKAILRNGSNPVVEGFINYTQNLRAAGILKEEVFNLKENNKFRRINLLLQKRHNNLTYNKK